MGPEPLRRDTGLSPRLEVPLGRVLITPGAQAALTPEEILTALNRHVRGDWGDVDAEDRAENDRSFRHGFRILSAYQSKHGEPFWIITEADRSSTTLLLPSEY